MAPVKPSLTIKRRFKASPAQVYAAWTQPEQLAKWMGPIGTTAAEAEADVRVGGRYHIRRLCGEGAMGRVYESQHIDIGRRVAIKVLHARYHHSADLV